MLDFVRLDARDIGPGPGTTPVRSGHEHVADLSSLCRVLSHGTRERGRRVETRAAGEARRQGRTTKFGEVIQVVVVGGSSSIYPIANTEHMAYRLVRTLV